MLAGHSGTRTVSAYLGEQLFLKEGGRSRRTPWHQDTSYLRMKGTQLVACWISLDPLPREHCLEFGVRGSHRGVLHNGSAFADDDETAPLYKHSPLPRLPDIQARRDEFDIVSWDVTPGDIIVFHLLTAARRARGRWKACGGGRSRCGSWVPTSASTAACGMCGARRPATTRRWTASMPGSRTATRSRPPISPKSEPAFRLEAGAPAFLAGPCLKKRMPAGRRRSGRRHYGTAGWIGGDRHQPLRKGQGEAEARLFAEEEIAQGRPHRHPDRARRAGGRRDRRGGAVRRPGRRFARGLDRRRPNPPWRPSAASTSSSTTPRVVRALRLEDTEPELYERLYRSPTSWACTSACAR